MELLKHISWEIIGIFALIFNILSFLEKNDKKMFILLAICSFFYGIHFYGLGLITASLINFFDIIKNISVVKYKKCTYLFLVLSLIYFFIGIYTSNGEIMSYLFTIASITSLFASFYLNGITLRIIYLGVIMIYLIYTIIGNSISGSINFLILAISLSSSIYILYKRKGFIGKIKYYKQIFIKKYLFIKRKKLIFIK